MGVVSPEMSTAVDRFVFRRSKKFTNPVFSIICVLSFGDRINEMTMNESFLYIVHVPNGSSISKKANLFLINRPQINRSG